MACCSHKRVEYGTIKGHWFLKSNLKIKLTILHIKSITKRVLSEFIIFVKYFSFTKFEGRVVKYAPSFSRPVREAVSFTCFLQERIKLYSLLFSNNSAFLTRFWIFPLTMLWGLPFSLSLCARAPFSEEKTIRKGAAFQFFFFSWGVEATFYRLRVFWLTKRKVPGAEVRLNHCDKLPWFLCYPIVPPLNVISHPKW